MIISSASQIIARYFASINVYGTDQISVYKYGFELLISTAVNLLGILIISVFMSSVFGAVLFCVAFIPLRFSAGGYHAQRHLTCILGFMAVFSTFATVNHYTDIFNYFLYSLVTITLSSVLVWFLSPVNAENKPLKDNQKIHQRKRSIIITCINMAILWCFCISETLRKYMMLFSFYSSGVFAASMSLAVATLQKKKKKRSER